MKYQLVLGLALLQLSGGLGWALKRPQNKFVVIGPNDPACKHKNHEHELSEHLNGHGDNKLEVHNYPEVDHSDLEVPNNDPEVVIDPEVSPNDLVAHDDLVPVDNVEVNQRDPEDEDDELTDEDIEDILAFILSQFFGDEDFSKLLQQYYERNGAFRNERSTLAHRYRKHAPHIKAKIVKHVKKYTEGKRDYENEENENVWEPEYDQNIGKGLFNFIEARNIFGNSVGNDKVTNLYIFNYKDSEENYSEEGFDQENYVEEPYEKKNFNNDKSLFKKVKE